MRLSLLLRNGAVAGAVAGLGAAIVMWLVTEPVIRRALVIEEARGAAEAGGHSHEGGLVSRGLQVGFGGVTTIIVGVLFGLVFAIVFAKVRHRLPGLSDAPRALWLAALGFFAFALMPWLVVPPNPPAVGDPETVNQRTLLYVLAVLVGLLLIGAVAAVGQALQRRGAEPGLRLAALVALTAVVVPLVVLLLPGTPDTIAGDVPPELVWDFRLVSLLQVGAIWLGLGVVFGLVTDRSAVRTRETVGVG